MSTTGYEILDRELVKLEDIKNAILSSVSTGDEIKNIARILGTLEKLILEIEYAINPPIIAPLNLPSFVNFETHSPRYDIPENIC